ncbi:Mediator of RNA polymerase II transcription subunit 12 [Hibiscus syriacus]|uniref:Mediator of RNA polymerase II transcription subunit 12 n=1 Tax=Hibiscus syriacus TaxID=106335 RepID=A0A6A2WWS1_HIBSY|nr:mediator of RNA polymerase II transcription subunit 12-like [Hibiscus syriacus]XP_039042527.1 mediator of RNA polymerase II transcription subunit 12-like [Hibiscus syriacus]XP_039042528.1 mediator of RNA polymerase II transcription subunit 12-like [Hibiscus syriacus]KAE8665811.1 Mediator of RNA polymerase II transcription subunit 12 [Hibiscus syriacus]
MQRYHATSCTSAVNNSIGGATARDNSRADSSSLPSNFSLNSRRHSQLASYKLKCDKEPLNSRLGPPDFHPQTQNCPEETLTRENVQQGYKETIDGLEDSKEISLTQVHAFTKPVVLKCKDAIRKCLRAINESRVQKRKAGQVYGVPLSGSLLSKPVVFPERRPCNEDFRKKWIEGLSLQHKPLCSLADQVPQGYKKRTLIEVLIRNNVPLLRATWFIKVTYLNQVRPGSAISSGAPDKSQLSRTELWTKDVIDYLQYLLDEFFSRNNSHSAQHGRERLPQMVYAGSSHHRSDQAPTIIDGDELSLHFKWWYVVRLLQWHHAEGLVLPSLIIDWVLNQLQEKELLEIIQLLLPIIYGVLETIILCQTYVRNLVGVAIRFICEPSPGGSDLVDNSRRAYTMSALVEMLRYLIQAVPDTFVALDCFPLPTCVLSHSPSDGGFPSKSSDDAEKIKNHLADVYVVTSKGFDSQYQALSFNHVVSTIWRRSDNLAKGASSGYPSQSVAKAVQTLDKALLQGDLIDSYNQVFSDLYDRAAGEGWVAAVSPCLRSSLKWLQTVNLSLICSVFFLCEWATCDYRDFRAATPCDVKLTGRKDFSQIYLAIQLLKLKMKELQKQLKKGRASRKNTSQQNSYSSRDLLGNTHEAKSNGKGVNGRNSSDIFDSPGPLHDIIVCWIDQHEGHKGEGSKRLQLFVLELIRSGIFYPQAYVRQLIVSGIIGTNGSRANQRRKRHQQILKQLPGQFLLDALEEARIAEGSELLEAVNVYKNERRLVLRELFDLSNSVNDSHVPAKKQNYHSTSGRDVASQVSCDQRKTVQALKTFRREVNLEELKASISFLLQFPSSTFTFSDGGVDESQGGVKRSIGSTYNRADSLEGTPGCEDCKRVKRQKLSEDKSLCLQVSSPIPSDDEDNWWVRKGPKNLESSKVDPLLKSAKQVSRVRQKPVRKTQSLAQLAAARIEDSQGASTSHVCDNKISCPHHRTEVENLKPSDGVKTTHHGDILSIAKDLNQLRFVEKRIVTAWLLSVVRQLVEESEKSIAKVGQYGRPFVAADEKGPLRWKLVEDELSAILYLLDVSCDSISAVKFLLWLLPKAISNPSPTIHGARNNIVVPRNVENYACEVGEAYLLSCLRRYENILVAADLVPEALSATMCCASAFIATNGRITGSGTLVFARYLLKRYGNIASVNEWKRNFKGTCDKRLLSELESGRTEGEFGFPLGVPAGTEDPDDYCRQRITAGRLSRVGLSMRDIVQRHFAANAPKSPVTEKGDDDYQVAQQIIMRLMDCFRQTGGAFQEGDPGLVSSAVSAIVSNVGPTLAKILDFTGGSNYSNYQPPMNSLNFAKRILHIHLLCLCLLKEALGERKSQAFEIALATEASSALAGAFAPAKSSRGQFQPDSLDSNLNISSDNSHGSAKATFGKTTKMAAAISALVIEAIIHGVISLERMVTVLRLKEGLDVVQFVRSTKTTSNGNARSGGAFKVDNTVEVYVHWFRLFVGNCRTVCDGLVLELLGEQSVLALSRMQRLLPINLVFPPAYAIYAFVIWKRFILNVNIASREDIHQLYQSLTMAIGDAVKHRPFRDVCMRDTHGFYDLVAADTTDAEFAALLELNGLDMHLKSMALVPLRARLFLDTLIDCKIPSAFTQDDGSRVSGHGESKALRAETGSKLLDELVRALDTLQPAKFHWQWVELRLLLNEQALIDKMENHDMSLVDAIRSSSPSSERASPSESEKVFIEIILTRLLVRPDAAPLFSEVIHLFGKSLEDSMLMQAKWFLGGSDVLLGRKTVRQRLSNIAKTKNLSTKTQFWKPWGWSYSGVDTVTNSRVKKKSEVASLEEGEVIEEGMESKGCVKGSTQVDVEGSSNSQQHVTEKAFVELVLPCIDQSSADSYNIFASDLIKQFNIIEQQINSVTRGISKQTGAAASGIEGSTIKINNRKGTRGGSPGLARRTQAPVESSPPSPAALRASISLRLHFIVRLLPIICADGEPSARNMRHMLASVILRLLGSRVVHEDVELMPSVVSSEMSGDGLFDRLLLVLHGLLSSCRPSWLKSKDAKDFSGLDRESVEGLQNELDSMQLPERIRWRIQAAMPILFHSLRNSISCHPSAVPIGALSSLQPSVSVPGSYTGTMNAPQRQAALARNANNMAGKSKSMPILQENEMEIDPWTLLEDGAGSGTSSSSTVAIGSSDQANLRASSWLKGAVRVRRTDLSYIGAVDDDS